MAPSVLEAAWCIVNEWSEDDIIKSSDSDYSSVPVYRMFIDYRDVNP